MKVKLSICIKVIKLIVTKEVLTGYRLLYKRNDHFFISDRSAGCPLSFDKSFPHLLSFRQSI